MAQVLVGTGFNQVVQFTSNDKQCHKTIYGTPARSPVRSITFDPAYGRIIYANNKTIYTADQSNNIQQIVTLQQSEAILDVQYFQTNDIRYCLSNGSIYVKDCKLNYPSKKGQKKEVHTEPMLQFIGQKHNKFNRVVANGKRDRYLFCGIGVVPIICNVGTGLNDWFGKNVKNDELDLQVPIKDIDAQFIRQQKYIAVLNADRKLRIYDVRGTHRRPIQQKILQTTSKSQMTRMKISQNQNQYFIANDIGQIYKCDSRKDWKTIAKYKGITTSITDLQISTIKNTLVASSLDSYVRIFDLESCKLIKKVYINKPAYCLDVIFDDDQKALSSQDGEEEELDLEDIEEEPKKVERLKQIRKRNKVGLKYLQPRQFDEPQVKQEDEVKQEWYQGLNPIDRRDFEQ